MKFNRSLPTRTRRDAWVEVNLNALEANLKAVKKRIPAGQKLMAIVKADAYGHGAVMITPLLGASGVSMLGVASMDEALNIRESGQEIPILVIGAIPDWAVERAAADDIALTVFEAHHLKMLAQAFTQTGRKTKVHIKVDTGMHRIGVPWQEAADFIKTCQAAPYLDVEGVFTHLACATDLEASKKQLDLWSKVLADVPEKPPLLHWGNSAGALFVGAALGFENATMTRLGLALYGYSEVDGDFGLTPVMGLKARIMQLKSVPPDEGVSYGHRYMTRQTTRVATVPLGYADGLFRSLSGKIEGLLHGRRVPQIGTMTMDQMMFDVTGVPEAALGDAITLIGEDDGERITLSDWAGLAGTIEYELMCALRVRLAKAYTRT